jgi:hypothetical protein
MAFQNHFGDVMPIFDGNSSIYCVTPLPFNDAVIRVIPSNGTYQIDI